jgi:hypothetical protein
MDNNKEEGVQNNKLKIFKDKTVQWIPFLNNPLKNNFNYKLKHIFQSIKLLILIFS